MGQQREADIGGAEIGGEEYERLLPHGELRQRPGVHADFGSHPPEFGVEGLDLVLASEFHRARGRDFFSTLRILSATTSGKLPLRSRLSAVPTMLK